MMMVDRNQNCSWYWYYVHQN